MNSNCADSFVILPLWNIQRSAGEQIIIISRIKPGIIFYMKNFWIKLNKPILALAPMAGITDSAFRQICKLYGADVVYSEMASVSALFFKPKKTLDLVKFSEKERPYVVQLFGKNPEHFAKATEIITNQIKPDGIDINFGCPAKKVFGHGSGCALMPQKELAGKIISSVCDNTNLPVSIKIRAGIGETSAIQFIENVKDLSFQAVMIHGRTYEGRFSGAVDFGVAEKIKGIIPEKIVLANGGITSPEIAKEVLEKYPTLDGLGIARGALGRPFIFDQIKSILNSHSRSEAGMTNYNFEKIKKVLLQHAELINEINGEYGMIEMRKHLAWGVKGFSNASELRQKLVKIKTLEDIKNIFD